MIRYCIISFLVAGAAVSSAQLTPMFETTFYFEDAVGNRDSVTVGYDTLATDDIDPEFGEVEILAPFDSVFEVRVASPFFHVNPVLAKRNIAKPERTGVIGDPNSCYDGGTSHIYIWAKYQPVKVKWRKQTFVQNSCVGGSLLSNHEMDRTIYPYDWDEFPENIYKCLAVNDSLVIDVSTPPVIDEHGTSFAISTNKEVEGLGIKEIYGLRYYNEEVNGYTPCPDIVSTEKVMRSGDDLQLYPNPGSGLVHIKNVSSEKIKGVKVFDLQGKMVYSADGEALQTIDLTGVERGLYLVMLTDENGRLIIEKLLKL